MIKKFKRVDNDGVMELILNGPYGGKYLDTRDGGVYQLAEKETAPKKKLELKALLKSPENAAGGDRNSKRHIWGKLFNNNNFPQIWRIYLNIIGENPIYEKILSKLASARYGVKKAKLQEEIGAPNGTYGRAIQDLVDCGYVIEYKKKYEEYNPLYIQLVDPFLLFHYHHLTKGKKLDSYEDLVSDMGRYDNWRGQAFEILCFNNLDSIKNALGISGVKTECYPWYNSEDKKDERVQIDMIIERADMITNLCEIKYTNKPFTIDAAYEQQLLRKRDVYKEKTGTTHALKIIMISAKGLSGTTHTSYIADVITLDDLFEG